MVIFAIVWSITPEFAQGVLQLRSYAAQVPLAAPPPEPAKKPAKAVKIPVKKVAKNTKPAVLPEPQTMAMPAYTERLTAVPAAEVRQPVQNPFGPSDFKISTETADLYSSNSPNGNVVRKLGKGELVELQFKVNNAGPEWMFVNVANPRGSGFVRSDTVSKAADQASR